MSFTGPVRSESQTQNRVPNRPRAFGIPNTGRCRTMQTVFHMET
jgi:hypothetical protein